MKYFLDKIIVTVIILSANICVAQTPMYSASEKSKEDLRKSNESLNAVYEANRPNQSNTRTTSSNNSELQRWVDATFGKKAKQEIVISPEQAVKNAQIGKVSAEESARQTEVRAKQRPFVDYFIKAGLNYEEAEYLIKYHIIDFSGNAYPNFLKALEIQPVLASLNTDLANTPFDSLQSKIGVITNYLPLKSFIILDKVKKRYADKALEIENMQISCLVPYFNSGSVGLDHEDRKKLLDFYFKLVKKQPQIDVYVLERTTYFSNPYESQIDYLKYYGAKFKEIKKYYTIYEEVQKKLDDKRNAICQTSAAIEAALASNNNISLDQIISKKYRNEFGSIQDPLKFATHKNQNLSQIDNYNVISLNSKNFNTHLRCSPQVLKELSNHGNIDAQYIYMIYLCAEGTDLQIKEQSEIYIKKAEEGDFMSLQLLFFSRIWQAIRKTPTLTQDEIKQNYNYLIARVEKSKIPAANLFMLGRHINTCFSQLIIYTNEKYPQLDLYRNCGIYLEAKYKSTK